MQNNPEDPKRGESAQAAEGELPDSKLVEVSGGSLAGTFANADSSVILNMIRMQSVASTTAQAIAQQTDLMTTLANNAATNAKNGT